MGGDEDRDVREIQDLEATGDTGEAEDTEETEDAEEVEVTEEAEDVEEGEDVEELEDTKEVEHVEDSLSPLIGGGGDTMDDVVTIDADGVTLADLGPPDDLMIVPLIPSGDLDYGLETLLIASPERLDSRLEKRWW